MLSNPHWNAPSFSSFEAWLETKNPNEAYEYQNCTRCACAQYLQHIGQYNLNWLADVDREHILSKLNTLASGREWPEGPSHTFGALLERVKAYQLQHA